MKTTITPSLPISPLATSHNPRVLKPLASLSAYSLLIVFLSLASFVFSNQANARTTLNLSNYEFSPESKIEIIFDRAVVKKEEIKKETTNTYLVSQPTLRGSLFWKSANIAVFTPSEPPLMGTQYHFSIAKGKKYLDGSPIPEKINGSFTSESFRVTRTTLRSASITYTRLPTYYIAFNDTVNIEKISPYVYFTSKNGQRIAAKIRRATWGDIKSYYYRGKTWYDRFLIAHKKKVSFGSEDNSPIPNAIMVSPYNPLPVAERWKINLSKKVSNAASNAHLSKNHTIWLGDVDPFEVTSISPHIEADQKRQIHINFSTYLGKKFTAKKLSRLIVISPKPQNATFKLLGRTLIVEGGLRKHNRWDVLVKPEIIAANGLPLVSKEKETIKFKTLPPALALPAYDSAQYSRGNRQYAIKTVNMASLHIRIKQLSNDKAVRAIQGYQHYKGRGHNGRYITPTSPLPYALIDGKTIYDKTIKLDNPIDTSRQVNLDWSLILPTNTNTSNLFISVEGVGKKLARGKKRIAQAFIQLTDIGLCWKINNSEALIYAFSCQTGKPLAHVNLQVFGDDAQPLKATTTDANGIARIPRTNKARHLRATLKNDCYIIPFDDTLDTVYLWRFPVDIEWYHLSGWKRTAMMFTDRNLYRPGETMHLKGIARRYLDNQIKIAFDRTAKLTITDSASRVLVDETITFSKNGTFDYTLKLPAETVGLFTAKLVFPDDPKQKGEDSWLVDKYKVFRHTFQVDEFRRNAFEITAKIPKVTPGATSVTLDLKANYYQGQPVKEGHIEWNFVAQPRGFYPDKFRDYFFGDHRDYDPYYWSYYFGYGHGRNHGNSTHRSGEGKLDATGQSSINFDLPKSSFPTALNVLVYSEITDSRDQTLSKSASRVVHPADTYIGISRIDKLIRVGEETQLKVIAVDTQGNLRKSPVKVQVLVEREYHESVKIKSPSGKTSIKNNKRKEKVFESELTIDPNHPTPLPFTPKKSGLHFVTLKGTDQEGRPFASSMRLWVYGSNEYPWAVENGMKIKLVPEQKQYKPGDTARILVMTPIEGTAVITLERADVHKVFHRELKADNPVIEVPLTDLDAPNVFLSVIVIRGAIDSPRKAKEPALKLGYCKLNVSDVKNKLAVDLKIEGSQHRPAEPTTISGTVKLSDGSPVAGAEVVLYAEDEGTLAVAGYNNPNPMKFFHASRPLLVECGTSFSTFLSENLEDRNYTNKGFTIGGGDDGGRAKIELKSRQDFDPCAVWKPSITTDAQGRFSVTFNNPDTLTRYRVIAVVLYGDDKFGSAHADYTVNKPIMLEPANPRYASEGDHLFPKVLIQNNSTFTGTWEVSLATSDMTRVNAQAYAQNGQQTKFAKKTITLKPGDATTVYFDVTFVNTGTAKWTWTARPISLAGSNSDPNPQLTPQLSRDLSDRFVSTFKVTYPVPLLHQTKFVRLNNKQNKDLLAGIKEELLNGRGNIKLELSNSLLLEASKSVDYLLHYPYGCVEQTTSSMMPWFAVRDLKAASVAFQDKTEEDIAKAIQKGVDRLLTMQTRDGGLAYWPGGKNPETWASSYGGLGLLLAREHGAKVPEAAIDRLTDWIIQSLKSKSSNSVSNAASYNHSSTSWSFETRARSLYILALAKKPQVAMQNKLLDQVDQLNPSARAFLALAMNLSDSSPSNKTKIHTLLSRTETRPASDHWMVYSSDLPMQVLAWSEIFPMDQQTSKAMMQLLANKNNQGHWRTTWCNAWALQAMASYARNVEKLKSSTNVEVVTASKKLAFTLEKGKTHAPLVLPLEKNMKLSISSDGPVYAQVYVSSKPEIKPSGPRAYNGLSIIRRYERVLSDGTVEPIDQPHVGDLIKVNLDVTFGSVLDYIVIEDRLPSLFETVNGNFESQRAYASAELDVNYAIRHRELRSDRAVFFLTRSWNRDTHTISYLARVTIAGTAAAPAAKVEAMYNPEQFALSESQILTTDKKEPTKKK